MYQVTKEIHFCYGHRLLKHRGKCAHLHGHNAIVKVTCRAASLDGKGMVVDFDEIASMLGHWVDKNLDHRMILHRKDKLIPHLKKWKEPHLVLDQDPTAEAIAKVIFDRARAQGLPIQSVTLWETPTAFATYSQ